MTDASCLFCKIVMGEIPSDKVPWSSSRLNLSSPHQNPGATKKVLPIRTLPPSIQPRSPELAS